MNLLKGMGTEVEEDEMNMIPKKEQSVWDYFIISRHNKLYLMWQTLTILCCLTSAYLYAYMAAFEEPHAGSITFILLYAHEGVFLISMILNFFVEYQNEGDVKPVRDIVLIGKRYINTNFRNDLIPLIPLQLIQLPHGYTRLFLIIKIVRIVNGFQLF